MEAAILAAYALRQNKTSPPGEAKKKKIGLRADFAFKFLQILMHLMQIHFQSHSVENPENKVPILSVKDV